MADTTRLPQGIVINGSLLVARPVNTIVESEGNLYRSTDASAPAYDQITLAPIGPWSLAYVGQGTGATKTTTVTDGPTVAEQFEVNDQLYFDWGIPAGYDRSRNPTLRVHFYLPANEPGKVVSWQLAVGDANGDRVDVIRQTITTADVPVNSEFVNRNADFLISATDVNFVNAVELTFRLARIASSDDPTADPRVHLIQVLP